MVLIALGGRGGGRGGYGGASYGPPDTVLRKLQLVGSCRTVMLTGSPAIGAFQHSCEEEMVCALTEPTKVPYFNAPIYLQNKTQIGKVDEILGPINEVFFTVKMEQGMLASSFKKDDKVYIGGDKLLPIERFLPKPKTPGAKRECRWSSELYVMLLPLTQLPLNSLPCSEISTYLSSSSKQPRSLLVEALVVVLVAAVVLLAAAGVDSARVEVLAAVEASLVRITATHNNRQLTSFSRWSRRRFRRQGRRWRSRRFAWRLLEPWPWWLLDLGLVALSSVLAVEV